MMTLWPVKTDPRGAIFVEPAKHTDMEAWHATAEELRNEAPVLRVEAEGWEPFWALTKHADVLDVSRRSDIFWNTNRSAPGPEMNYMLLEASGIELPRTLVHMHGAEHQAYREVTNEWFKPAAVKHRQAAIEAVADSFIAKLDEMGGECDLAQDLAVPFTLRVIMSIFGIPEDDEKVMLGLTQGLFGAADPEYLGSFTDPLDLVRTTLTSFGEYFDAVTADRRANPTDDLATVIANGTVFGEPLGEAQRLWYYIIVATAGHDTTSYALSGGVAELLRHPDQLAALLADPDLASQAAEEMIRWTSPVRSFFRYPQEDVVIRDVEIKAGEAILTSYPSANRDADVFDDPMRFNIARTDADRLLSFGLGVHYCLGSQIARREVRTMLRKLMEHVETIELAGDPQFAAAHFVGGVKHLPVRYTLKKR